LETVQIVCPRPTSLISFPRSPPILAVPHLAAAPSSSTTPAPKRKNWEGITSNILNSEKEKTTEEDPNVGGDSTLNSFFQKIFGDADEDTKRAMMKSYSESGGTTLSTNWEEVQKETVTVKPPAGAEWKKWN
jgi:suppressor of G2 allele of SKP1